MAVRLQGALDSDIHTVVSEVQPPPIFLHCH